MIIDRSYSEISENNLKELLSGSINRLSEYFIYGAGKKWSVLYNIAEPLCVALCQGAAMHYYDKKNGVKDFDVWFFYPFNQKHLPYRTIWCWDYKELKFGRHPDFKGYSGRKVDVIVRSLRKYTLGEPLRTIATFLSEGETKTARELSRKAVVLLSPDKYFGRTIWYRGQKFSN